MIESGRCLSNTVALTPRCPPPFRGWSSPTTTSCAASTRSTPGPGGRGGFVTYPLIEDDSVARRLREIGLDRLDAHHVMLAIKRECAAFVTCHEATILKYRTLVEAEFPVRLMLPSEFTQRYRDTVDPRGPKVK